MNKITSFLHKTFQSLDSSIILPFGRMGYYLAKCAKSQSYIETLGKHADSLHLWVKSSYEEDFKKAFESQVRRAIKNLNATYVKLAFDITHEPFYGKTRGLYIFDTPKDKKYDGEFRYVTACIITRNKQIPLMALPVRLGGVTKLTIDLLKYCQTLFKKIRFIVFDRGFYIAELIDHLEACNLRYLILVPEKKGLIKKYVESTDMFGKYYHRMRYAKNKSVWKPKTKLVVCKDLNKSFSWIFATNIHFKTRSEYIWHYKRRWQIETNYRVEDEAKIKSKSTNHLIRYFYFLIGLLFHLLWIVNKYLNYYVPFKKYLDIIEQELLFGFLKIEQI